MFWSTAKAVRQGGGAESDCRGAGSIAFAHFCGKKEREHTVKELGVCSERGADLL